MAPARADAIDSAAGSFYAAFCVNLFAEQCLGGAAGTQISHLPALKPTCDGFPVVGSLLF